MVGMQFCMLDEMHQQSEKSVCSKGLIGNSGHTGRCWSMKSMHVLGRMPKKRNYPTPRDNGSQVEGMQIIPCYLDLQ